MFETFLGISVDQAISALHGATAKLREDFGSKCFPDVPFSSDNAVELGFLAVYFIDGIIKNPPLYELLSLDLKSFSEDI